MLRRSRFYQPELFAAIFTLLLGLSLLENARRFPPDAKSAYLWGLIGIATLVVGIGCWLSPLRQFWERWFNSLRWLGGNPTTLLAAWGLVLGGALLLDSMSETRQWAHEILFYLGDFVLVYAALFCLTLLAANFDRLLAEENPVPDILHTYPVWVWVGMVLLAFGLTLLVSMRFWPRTLDDAWITYRFGRNLAEGHGLRWNPSDQEPFEAYTSFLHLLFSALFIKLGLNPETASKALGVFTNFGVLAMFAIYAKREKLHHGALLFAMAAFASNILFGFHAVMGMDTPLFTFYLTEATLMLLLSLRETRITVEFFVAIVVGILVRPDAGLLFGLYYAIWLIFTPALSRQVIRWSLGLLVLPGLAYIAFKWLYFGSILTNTYNFKVGEYAAALPGEGYVRDFFGQYMIIPIAAVAVFILLRKIKFSELLIFLSIIAALLFYITLRPKVAIGFRFLIPFYPSLLLVLIAPISRFLAEPHYQLRLRYAGLSLLLVGILAGNLIYLQSRWNALYQGVQPRVVNIEIGKALADLDNPQEIVLVTGEAGAIPYFSDLYHLDLQGLTTPAVSPVDPAWIFDYPVDIFVTHSIIAETRADGTLWIDPDEMTYNWQLQENSTEPLSYKVLADPRFSEFDLIAKVPYRVNPDRNDYYYVFVRRDFEEIDLLRERFGALQVDLEY